MNPYHGLRTEEPATFQLGIILSLGPGRWVVPPCADKVKNSFITLVWWSGLVACQSLSGQGAELHQETIRYLTQSLTSSLSLSSLSDFETVLSLLLSRTLARFLARTLARSLTRTHARTQVDYFRDFLGLWEDCKENAEIHFSAEFEATRRDVVFGLKFELSVDFCWS